MNKITNVETVDVNGARHFFEASADYRTGDDLYDAAVEYFGDKFFRSIDYKHKYRQDRNELLGYMALEEAEVLAEGYQRMFERVVEARRFLEVHAQTLLELWQHSKNSLHASYTDVLADIVSNSPEFIERFFDSDEDAYNRDCFNAVQWLDGWLRSEKVDQQG